MFDSDKMLRPRQAPTFSPGLVNPTFSAPPPPALPISTGPISSSDGVKTETFTFSETTLTLTIGSNPIPSPPSSTTGFQTSSILTSSPTFATPTSTTASAPPSTTAPANPNSPLSFTFFNPSNSTTCVPLRVDWSVSNSNGADPTTTNIDLGLVSVGNNEINMTLASGWPVLNDPFTWQSVSVPPGQYQITGRLSDGRGTTVQSSAFAVQAGSNTSCIAGAGGTPINTAKSVSKGAIAGGTVGGVIILGCVCVAFFFLYGSRSRRGDKRVREPRRTWGGLGSVDDKTSGSRNLVTGDSNDYLGAATHSTPTPGGVASTSSLEGEKFSPTSTSPTGLPTLEHKTPWAAPAGLELARLSSRPSPHESPRSSLDFPADPFSGPPSRRASRTPRKPVPAYEPTPEEFRAMEMARTGSGQSRARSTHSDSGHQPSTSLTNSSGSHHELRTKSSGLFDGQPVHYLIPDMPPQSSS